MKISKKNKINLMSNFVTWIELYNTVDISLQLEMDIITETKTFSNLEPVYSCVTLIEFSDIIIIIYI